MKNSKKGANKEDVKLTTGHAASVIPASENKMDFENSRENEKSSKVIYDTSEIKVFKRRWLQLALFVIFSISNNVQWYQYSIINNIIRRYYNVSSLAIDWTSMIFMVTYMLLIFPLSYFMDRIGLRWTILIGSMGTCLGAWLKVFSTSPDRFVLTFFGQFLVAVSQIFIQPVSGKLAAYWFGPKQIALATAIAFMGIHIGFSSCFLTTPIIIKNHENIDDIGKDLAKLFWTVAISCSVVTVVLFFFFQNEPPSPPSESRALQKKIHSVDTEGFWPPVKRILCNKNFIILWNSYGLMLGSLGTVNTLINPFYLAHFKNGEEDVGKLGLLMGCMGALGSVIFASILDHTKKFRAVPIFICVATLFGEILFATSFSMEIKWMVYVAGMILGTFLIGFASIGIELCAEATYPESEGISMGILNISNQVYGSTLIFITGRMIEMYGDKAGHLCLLVVITFGTILMIINKGELRRQKAERISDYNALPLRVIVQSKQSEETTPSIDSKLNKNENNIDPLKN